MAAAAFVKVPKLIKKRERYFISLQMCFDLIKKLPAEQKIFVARCNDLSVLYTKFEDVKSDIGKLNSLLDDENKVDTTASSKQFDIIYYEIQATYQALSKLETTATKTSETKFKLPQINIQKV